MTVDPVGETLTDRPPRKRVGAGSEYGDKQGRWRHFARLMIVDGHRRPGPVHKHLFARTVLLPHHDVVIPDPPLVQLAKAALTVPVRLILAILFPNQLQRQMTMRFQFA